MVRPLRFQCPGAVYHVMARGDGGKVVFETDDDRLVFLKRLEETCASSGWRVHAWVLMDNHFHLLQVDKSKGVKARKRSRSECVGQDHGEKEVERLIRQCAPHLGLPKGTTELAQLRKRDERKAMCWRHCCGGGRQSALNGVPYGCIRGIQAR